MNLDRPKPRIIIPNPATADFSRDEQLPSLQDAIARRTMSRDLVPLNNQEILDITEEIMLEKAGAYYNPDSRFDDAGFSELDSADMDNVLRRTMHLVRRFGGSMTKADIDRITGIIKNKIKQLRSDELKDRQSFQKTKQRTTQGKYSRVLISSSESLSNQLEQRIRTTTDTLRGRVATQSEIEMTRASAAAAAETGRGIIQSRIEQFRPGPTGAPRDPTRTIDPADPTRPAGTIRDPTRPSGTSTFSTDVDLDQNLFDEQIEETRRAASLSADERFVRAGRNLGYTALESRTSVIPSNRTIGVGTGAGFGILAAYGATQLVGSNPYAQAAVGGVVADVTTRVAGAATEAALARSSAVFAEQIATREAIQGAMLGATEAGILSVALMPVDMAYHHFLEQRINNPVLVNVIDAATFGGAMTGLGVGLSAALAPETMGVSLAAGAVATAIGTIIGAFEGDREARARQEQEAAYQQALADQAAAQAEVDAIRTRTEERTRFLKTLPTYDYNFTKAWTAFDDKEGLGMTDPDYGDWANNTRGIFQDVPKIPHIKQQDPNVDTTSMTAEETRTQNLYNMALQNAMIDRVCQEATGECDGNLLSHRNRDLSPEEIEFLNQQSAGLAFTTIAQQVELQYQEFEMLHGRQAAARTEIKRLWDEDRIDIYMNPDEADQLMIDRSNTSTNFTEEMQNYIRNETQREIMAAYYHDGTKIDDIEPEIAAAASRYDPGYYQAVNTFYNGMEYNANQLGIDIFQLMELQAIEQEDLWDYTDPANTGKGRRQMYAELADMRAEKQLKRYQEMLNFNIENNPQLLLPDSDIIPNPIADQASGIDRSNQIAIDEYNTNLRQALSVLQDDYENAVEAINNQRLYQGRNDLLYFQTADLYNRYRIDSIPQPDGGVAHIDTGAAPNPQISNTAEQMKEEAINNIQQPGVSYVDIINYVKTIDGYDELSSAERRELFEYYANNLNALPEYITNPPQQPRVTENQVLEYFEKYYPPTATPYNTLNNEDYNNLINHYINNPELMNEPPQIPTNEPNGPAAKALKASGIKQAPTPPAQAPVAPTPPTPPAPTPPAPQGDISIAPTNA